MGGGRGAGGKGAGKVATGIDGGGGACCVGDGGAGRGCVGDGGEGRGCDGGVGLEIGGPAFMVIGTMAGSPAFGGGGRAGVAGWAGSGKAGVAGASGLDCNCGAGFAGAPRASITASMCLVSNVDVRKNSTKAGPRRAVLL